jgi:hypothetical protein
MARRVHTSLVDDLDGSVADRTVALALDGRDYEVDLSAANLGRLTSALTPFLEVARKVSKVTAGKPNTHSRGQADRSENHAIREWARGEGFQVTARGRLPGAVVTAYRAAQVG